MNRVIAAAAAGLLTAGLVGAVHAATPAGYYVAVPATAPARTGPVMTRSTVWTWQGEAFVADRAPEREVVLCELVAQRAGKLASFSVAGQPFDADTLAKCNARAK